MPKAKYGVVGHRNNANIGDDIQVYATKLLLPSFDYLVDREHINTFESKDGEPVAMITSAWWTWRKWNWPFSKVIIPHFIGFHYADHELAKQPGSPLKYEMLTGEGMKFLKAYEPIGCRDTFTVEQLRKIGVDAYFTGCITLTLPKMPKKDMGRYICAVSLNDDVVNKLKEILKGTGVEVRVYSHTRTRDPNMTWEAREKFIEERLTIYQNAICVVTKKLHCSLPCLAMDVPVLLIKEMEDDIRFSPYYEWMHFCKTSSFLKGEYEYDFVNPPANPGKHIETRENLIKSVKEFVDRVEAAGDHAEKLIKYKHNDRKFIYWQIGLLKETMDKWIVHLDKNLEEIFMYRNKYRDMLEQYNLYNATVSIAETEPPMDFLERDIKEDYRYKRTAETFLKSGNIDYEYEKIWYKGRKYNRIREEVIRYKNAFDVLLDYERSQKNEIKWLRRCIVQLRRNHELEPETVKANLEKLAKYKTRQRRLIKGKSLKVKKQFSSNEEFFSATDEE